MATVFLPLDPQAVHRVRQVNSVVLRDLLDGGHAAVEVGVQGENQGAVGERLDKLRGGDLVAGQKNDGRDARSRSIGRERRRSVAGRGAGDGVDRLAVRDHLFYDRDQDGHSEVLERAGVGVPALLYPEIFDTDLFAVAIGPEEVGVAFERRDDVLVVDEGNDPLLLGPHSGAVGIGVLAAAIVEEFDPRGRCPGSESVDVVVHFEQITARRAAVDHLEQAELARAAVDALKPRVIAHD
jgi:hypothetical protein